MTLQDMKNQSNWSILWYYIQPDRRLFYFTSIVIFVNIIISMIAPLLLSDALNSIYTPELIYLSVGYGLVVLLSWWITAFQTMLTSKLSSRAVARLREGVYERVLNNNMTFFNDLQVGQVVSKVSNDSNELINVADRLAYVVSSFFILGGVIFVMLYFSIELTLFSLILLPVVFLLVYKVRDRVRIYASIWRHQFGLVNANFNEIFSSIAVSKSFGREQDNLDRFITLNEATFQASKKRGFWIFLSGPIMDFFRHLILILILLTATVSFQQNNLDPKIILVFFVILDYFYGPITRLANNYQQFQDGWANLDRMLSIIAEGKDQEHFGIGHSADHLSGQIDFKHVTFSYLPNTPVLKNVNFSVAPGENIAIVGHTGAGKTTFISLLLRFYDLLPEKGSQGDILLDGISIKDYELHSLRNSIALVSQNIFLFSGSIRDNLLLANPKATDEELWEALTISNAYNFVTKLPGTLDYHIGERASRISLGERQLLSIARAVLAKPRILILDEATSSVDLYTESLIQEGLESIMRGRTSIVIAHRLTTIVKSDRIMVLDHGEIVETGSHNDLLEKKGKYFEIYDAYFKHQSIDFLSGEIIS